jgi:hypothetical protein
MGREGLSFRAAVGLSLPMIFGRYSVGAWSAGGTLGRSNKSPVVGVGEVDLVADNSVLRCFSAEEVSVVKDTRRSSGMGEKEVVAGRMEVEVGKRDLNHLTFGELGEI